jgi:hypothetical protein
VKRDAKEFGRLQYNIIECRGVEKNAVECSSTPAHSNTLHMLHQKNGVKCDEV